MLGARPRLLILLGLMLSIGLVLGLVGQAPSNGDRLLPNPKVPADQTIDVGLQISNVYNLSLRDKTFTAEGWYWLKWPEAVQQRIDQGQIPVEGLVEFANQVERWDMSIEPANKEPQRTADGRYLQVFRFSGRFYDDHQNLSMFPLNNSNCRSASRPGRHHFRWPIKRLCFVRPRQKMKYWAIRWTSMATR